MKLLNITGETSESIIDNFREIVCVIEPKDINKFNNYPTLIIGWKNTKQLFPNISFFEKKITDSVYWIFSESEKGLNAVTEFNEIVPKIIDNFLTKKIKFFNINPTLNNHLDMLSNSEIVKVFNAGRNVYILDNKNYIYHIDLDLFKFLGLETNLPTDKSIKPIVVNNLKLSDKHLPYLAHINDLQNTYSGDLCKEASFI